MGKRVCLKKKFIIPIIIVLVLLTTSCISQQSNPYDSSTIFPLIEPAKAVYLIGAENSTLSASELQNFPEIVVVTSFDEFKAHAQTEVGLWIDKNAVDLLMIDREWIHQPPQRYYPIVLVGYNDALYAFRDVLGGFGIEGPYVDWDGVTLEPGFSVWMITEDSEHSLSSIMKGYTEIPSVENILTVTNDLLPQSLALMNR